MCALQSILHVLFFYPSEAQVHLSRLFHCDPLKLLITERMFIPVLKFVTFSSHVSTATDVKLN
jgi:hypothetical protein